MFAIDPSWQQLLGSIFGGIILFGTAVKAWPAVWTFIKNAAKVPTVIERINIAFTPNSGSSLIDKVDGLVARQEQDFSRLTEVTEETARVVVATKEMDEYLHTRVHEVLNIVAKDKSWAQLLVERLDKIEARLDASERGDVRVAEHLITSEREHRQAAADITEHIDRVHDEIRTGNALTLGALADDEETRRIILKPLAERTQAEHEHLRQIPSKENPDAET